MRGLCFFSAYKIVDNSMKHVFFMRDPFEIRHVVVISISVDMIHFAFVVRNLQKSFGY